MEKDEVARIDSVTGTLVPTPGPNRILPPLNPLKARSTIAGIMTILGVMAPLLNGGIGEIVSEIIANGDTIQDHSETLITSINVIVGVVGLGWFWLERRAPNFRLSFRSR